MVRQIRPCYCDHCDPGDPYLPGMCRLCWLFHAPTKRAAEYRAAFSWMFWTLAHASFQPWTAQINDPPCGVVLGCYRYVELIELQIKVIRYTCGPVPILVSDDCSPRSREMQEVCARYPDVDFVCSEQRIGHAGGDMAAYERGIRWAKQRGLWALAKLSNRWICVTTRWLQEGCRAMLEAKAAASSDSCIEGPNAFPVRTESVLLDVDAWHRPDILEYIRGRPIRMACEHIIWHVIQNWFGGKMHTWKLLNGTNRMNRAPGVIWHTNTPLSEYLQLASRFGVDLGPEFNIAGSHLMPDYIVG